MSNTSPEGSRRLSPLDHLIVSLDRGLRTIAAAATSAGPHPDDDVAEADLSDAERHLSGALMRVNHTGEVCAQALYQGQALTARDGHVRALLEAAAREETDHLAWTERRIDETGSHRSVLNPLFYAGSFALGALSGLAGDRWNLGFLAETERQVEGHIEGHLGRLPAADAKSRAILERMRQDEARHARTALHNGGEPFPAPLKVAMKLASRVMTSTAFRI